MAKHYRTGELESIRMQLKWMRDSLFQIETVIERAIAENEADERKVETVLWGQEEIIRNLKQCIKREEG